MEEGRIAFQILIGKLTAKRPRRRWDNIISMELEEISIYTNRIWKLGISKITIQYNRTKTVKILETYF